MKDLLEELKEIRASEYARLEERIQRRSRQVREDLAREIKKRQDNGASIMDIAKELGYKTRQSVYTLLNSLPQPEENNPTATGNEITVTKYTNFESKRALAAWDGKPFTGTVTWNPETRTAEPKNPLAHEVEAYPEKWSL